MNWICCLKIKDKLSNYVIGDCVGVNRLNRMGGIYCFYLCMIV